MHFYRSINCIKAITFDLDDTLYDNSMIVDKAEEEMMKSLQQYEPLQDLTLALFYQEKQAKLAINPEIYHDVVVWRIATIKSLLSKTNIPVSQHTKIIDNAVNCFDTWRHKIDVPQSTHILLAKLAKKYSLGVITNGNVDINRIGLGSYFQFSLRGGPDGRSKPFPEIFDLAGRKLAIPHKNILHVGDNLETDVNGAVNSGYLACWINTFAQDIYHLTDAKRLPHVEITRLPELENLL
jgi:FMN hydrolase / 5-amino-6-(5-phospho-D-ribitylamino)uracil phosphatase